MGRENQTRIIFVRLVRVGSSTFYGLLVRYARRRGMKVYNYRSYHQELDGVIKRPYSVYSFHQAYNPEAQDEIVPGGKYVVLLREPVDRVLSEYYKYLFDAPMKARKMTRNQVSEAVKEKMPFNQWFNEEEDNYMHSGGVLCRQSNHMTKWLSYPYKCDLEQAKKNLDNFAVVGLMEKYDLFLREVKEKLGFKDEEIQYSEKKRYNANRPRTRTGGLTEGQLETIRKKNDLDIKLYDYVRRNYYPASS